MSFYYLAPICEVPYLWDQNLSHSRHSYFDAPDLKPGELLEGGTGKIKFSLILSTRRCKFNVTSRKI
jgi:hypothetical protein